MDSESRSVCALQSVGHREDEDVIVGRGLGDLAVAAENNHAVEGGAVECCMVTAKWRRSGYGQRAPHGSASQAVGIGEDPGVIEVVSSADCINPAVHNHPVI